MRTVTELNSATTSPAPPNFMINSYDQIEKDASLLPSDIIELLYVVSDVLCCPSGTAGGASVTSSPSRRNF